jgi:bifunctional enzyme CysN/CysC
VCAAASVSAFDILEDCPEQQPEKKLLRFLTCGSVDDGKSTLIGRLLYDSRSVFEDQLESVTKASIGRNAGAIDFSLLTDGLRAEREQGITIDVAYRYFATDRRKFIIADTPGHEQYTRNMATGASTADLAVVLVDSRKGLLPQSKRHSFVASLLGIRHLVIAVNKMDMVGYSRSVFSDIERQFRDFLSGFENLETYFIPVSALVGDNIVLPSRNMPWFDGPPLLEYLEKVDVESLPGEMPFRFPVQRVVRSGDGFRGYAGTVASGKISVGTAVAVMPSGRTTTIERITTFDGDLHEASAGQPVTLTLTDEIDIIRGDLLTSVNALPHLAHSLRATLIWLHADAGEVGKRYRLKHATQQTWASIAEIHHTININTLRSEPSSQLEMNSIAVADIETSRALWFDPYQRNRVTGSFILIDPATNATVAAGMIAGPGSAAREPKESSLRNVAWAVKDESLVISIPGLAHETGLSALDYPEALQALEYLLNLLDVDVEKHGGSRGRRDG